MIRHLLAACGCLLALPALALAPDAGTIKTLRGEVRIERAGAPVAAQVGDPVFKGDRVSVRGDGSIGISMRDETLLSLGPNSTLVIDGFAYNPTTREGQVETSILKGTLRFVTGLIGRLNPAAVKVTTPTATVGIRGTDFIVEVPDENQ
jgi:hypothetical protein